MSKRKKSKKPADLEVGEIRKLEGKRARAALPQSAVTAVAQAVRILEPHAEADPRVAAITRKLIRLREANGGTNLADLLVKAEQAGGGKVLDPARAEYLRQMSPAAAAAWEAARAA